MTQPGSTTPAWSDDELQCIDAAVELDIAVRRPNGTLRRWTPIWVVCADAQVYVRTWYRRDTGWYGHALRSQQARVRVPGLEVDVVVTDLGSTSADLCEHIDNAYNGKYHAGSASMMTASAGTTTLQLDPEHNRTPTATGAASSSSGDRPGRQQIVPQGIPCGTSGTIGSGPSCRHR